MKIPTLAIATLGLAWLTVSGCSRDLAEPATGFTPAVSRGPSNAVSLAVASRTLQQDESLRRHWLDKTARLLRAGQGLRPSEMEALLKLTPEQAIDQFQRDPRFADTMLDFNLYFLGQRPDSIRRGGGGYANVAFKGPQSITAAREFLKPAGTGDYFKLLDLVQPFYLGALGDSEAHHPGDDKLDSVALRHLDYTRMQADLDRIIAALKANPKMDIDGVGKLFGEHFDDGDFFYFGLGNGFVRQIMTAQGWYGELYSAVRNKKVFERTDILKAFEHAKEVNAKFFATLERFEPATYKTKTVADIQAIDLKELGVSQRWTSLNPYFNLLIPNSSTNFNRKRASYFLSRYFCDDLTPINIVSPETPDGSHAGSRHASEASCQACHYKLDPMAGYFKQHGYWFKDFSDLPFVRLEDMVRVPHEEYAASWRAPEATRNPTGREWDIGYIRSATKPALNDYGSSIDDLFALLRRAPEVKRCMVKRLFDYVVSDRQAVDEGYLQGLTKDFVDRAATDSVAAVRQTIKQLVLSKAFVERDPVVEQCYDYPAGYDPAGAPPCKVAYVLRKNCASCHSGAGAEAGLDLTRWVTLADGTRNFPHEDITGKPIAWSETRQRIAAALSSTDPNRAMPLRKDISSADREAIYLWAQGSGR